MKEYMVEFDAIKGTGTTYYETDNYGELIEWVEIDLRLLGGGHADIYDEEGEFIDDVEI